MKNRNIDFEALYQNIASELGVSTEQVKIKLQNTITDIFTNPTKEQTLFLNIIPKKEELPTFEELSFFIAENFDL